MGISAASAIDVSEEELRAAKFQLIFGSVEIYRNELGIYDIYRVHNK